MCTNKFVFQLGTTIPNNLFLNSERTFYCKSKPKDIIKMVAFPPSIDATFIAGKGYNVGGGMKSNPV